MKRSVIVLTVAASFALAMSDTTQAVVLVNPGFDVQDVSAGDVYGSTGWSPFNNVFTTQNVLAHSSPNALKVFGPFFQFGGSGVVQGGFAASAGQTWEASAYARIDSSDPMDPQNFAVVKLEFLDSANAVIGFAESPQITTTSLPVDTWQKFTTQGVAPAGTTTAQIVLVHVQIDDPPAGGSIFFDDAAFGVIPEPASMLLGMLGLVGMAGFARRRAR